MPKTRDGMESIETSVPKPWKKKIDQDRETKGMKTQRQWLRDLIYENFIKDGQS